uniref:GNAT family N-acetyltransferase n=1 Tax=Ningiella ruwaisensis TaxID=2364274 RepID=UPI00109F884D|nr:GNAT family N-acetyltransferase [Ningiella ruwaisensis]
MQSNHYSSHYYNQSSDSAFNDESELFILPFEPHLAVHFERINRIWIEEMFVLEKIDERVLQNPQRYIIDKGGYVFFVSHKRLGIVGTCALMHTGDQNFELTKMGVLPQARGLKVGEQLLQFVIQYAKQIPANMLYLLTNKKCAAAIHLYEKNGFHHDAGIMERYGKAYERCNVAMLYRRCAIDIKQK